MWPLLRYWQIGAGAVLGALVAAGPVYLVGKSDGRQEANAAALQKSIELIQERGRTNVEVGKLDDGGICRELGGVWVRDHCE